VLDLIRGDTFSNFVVQSLYQPRKSKMTEDELIEFVTKKLNSLPLFPHQRLGYPPMCKGKDVSMPSLIVEETFKRISSLRMN
jgi:hypothetical protein